MIPLLCAAALVDTVCIVDEYECVAILEWGVVSQSSETLLISGFHDEESSQSELVDRAPVVYFYGLDFQDAVFSVTLESGEFTDFHPLPSSIDTETRTASWNITSGTDMGIEPIPADRIPFSQATNNWDMSSWRDDYNHVLEFEDGTMDRFIYYECSIPYDEEDPFYPFSRNGMLSASFDGQVLVFSAESRETGMKMTLCEWPDMPASTDEMRPYQRAEVIGILCDWSAGSLKSHQLEDLWNTWEGYVLSQEWEGDRLLVFQIPSPSISELVKLDIDMPLQCPVHIERFYLGMVPFSWTY
jgi:hypothetical protein